MEVIGLIAAMSKESAALLHRLDKWQRIKIDRLPGFTFSISAQPCVLVTCGMGINRAAEATHLLVEEFTPRLLISYGIAGAVEADLEIGDVILAEAYCRFDKGAVGELIPLAAWPETAQQAAIRALFELKRSVYHGTAVTTGGTQVAQGELGAMKHPVLEMETAGIARVAGERGIPLLSLRAISDGPRDPIPLDLEVLMDEDANIKVGKLLEAVIHKPQIVWQSRRMRRNSAMAAEYAALALSAALSHWNN